MCRDDLAFSLEEAANFLDLREWDGESIGESKAQERADKEAAKRIRRMAKKLFSQNSFEVREADEK